MLYRNAEKNDAKKLWELMLQIDRETRYMLYEEGEREKLSSPENLGKKIETSLEKGELLLLAFDGEELVGFLGASREEKRKIKHSSYVVTGILQSHINQGIGTEFFRRLDRWAREEGLVRLELTVMCENEIAKHLYEKAGFVVEGRRKKSIFMDGNYLDEYAMAKILEEPRTGSDIK
ncbi:MAG: GNAT family protein [Filifactor alocis]|nr:GNAT family protein [Filifactor alocis]